MENYITIIDISIILHITIMYIVHTIKFSRQEIFCENFMLTFSQLLSFCKYHWYLTNYLTTAECQMFLSNFRFYCRTTKIFPAFSLQCLENFMIHSMATGMFDSAVAWPRASLVGARPFQMFAVHYHLEN